MVFALPRSARQARAVRTGSTHSARCRRSATAQTPKTRVEAPVLVSDVMTSGSLLTVTPDNSVDEALDILVSHRVSGLPVVDHDGVVVGVVSDYDLLYLDGILAEPEKALEKDIFPAAGSSWKAFKDIKTLLRQTGKQRVSEVMTADPICVPGGMCMEEAARILLLNKVHRLPVTSEDGRLVGVLSRSNIVKAVLHSHNQARENVQGSPELVQVVDGS